jgi:hypothetical protein
MNQKSSKFSIYAILTLVLGVVVVSVFLTYSAKNDSGPVAQADIIGTTSIPFKIGENNITLPRNLDLAGKFIGLNGSLITLKEAKRRGIVEGIFKDGKEIDETYLLSANSSFIIKVKDISSSPALFF